MMDGDAAARRPGAVLCVGRVYCDLVFTGLPRRPTPGTEVFARGLSVHPGGGAAITAAWLAGLGRRAMLCAHLPAPPFEAVVRDGLRAAGVDLALCAPAVAGADPQVTVAMVEGGDRAFLTRADGPAAPPVSAATLAAAGVAHLHVGELATLRERPDLVDAARGAGATLSCDCGWDDATDAGVGPLLAALDVFLPNEAEAAQLAALGVSGARLTVTKRGAAGARAEAGALVVEAPARAAPVVDPTGAGDAFDAGFLDRWLAGAPLAEALAAGNACGARAVGAAGGITAAAAEGIAAR